MNAYLKSDFFILKSVDFVIELSYLTFQHIVFHSSQQILFSLHHCLGYHLFFYLLQLLGRFVDRVLLYLIKLLQFLELPVLLTAI